MAIPSMTVIIPAYNEEKLLKKTLASVKRSAEALYVAFGKTVEIIVVNNASTDDTEKIALLAGVKVVFEPKRNIAAVRNSGVREAKGDILCFMDADSVISRNVFLDIYNAMTSGNYVGGGTKFKLDRRGLIFSFIFVASVLATHFTGISGVLLYTKKEFYYEVGGFNEEYFAAEDIFFVIELFRLAKRKKLRYKNIYRGYIVTSARKFDSLKFKDLVIHGGLLLHSNLRKNPDRCYSWYSDTFLKGR